MDNFLTHLVFSMKLYLLVIIISIMIMEIVVLIRRFIRLGKGD